MTIERIPNIRSLLTVSEECANCGYSLDTCDCGDTHEATVGQLDASLIDPLLAAAREVAAERPDYVYVRSGASFHGRCTYTRGDGVRCVIGEALHRLGMTDDELDLMDNCDESQISGFFMDDLEDDYYPLQVAQDRQDGGMPWGNLFVGVPDVRGRL